MALDSELRVSLACVCLLRLLVQFGQPVKGVQQVWAGRYVGRRILQ